MASVIEQQSPTMPTQRQAQEEQNSIAAQKIKRLRDMESFFKSLPDRREEAGLGPVPDNIRDMAYEDSEDVQL